MSRRIRIRILYKMALSATAATAGELAQNTEENCQDLRKTQELSQPIRNNDCFYNPWPNIEFPGLRAFLKWRLTGTNNTNLPKSNDSDELDRLLPIVKPNLEELNKIPDVGIRVTWIGHATVLVQFDGITILTDPVFSQRCSPFQFLGPKRFRDIPCDIKDLPNINIVVISHNHYDHLDCDSVKTLNARFGKDLKWYVPMGLKQWFVDIGVENVVEMTWWEEQTSPTNEHIKVACVPAQHWSSRSVLDRCKTLWAGWVIEGPCHTFYFAGDTGYCEGFKEIGAKYGPIDLAAIPIGAYEPRWFMRCQHVDPAEAVQVHIDVKAKKSVGIHWGTFALAYEYFLEPPQKLQDTLDERNLPQCDFFVLKHGESKLVTKDSIKNSSAGISV